MPNHVKNVAVFCGSSTGTNPAYIEDAKKLGRLIGRHHYDLVYGGGFEGLMGAVSQEAVRNGSKVTGVMLQAFKEAAEPYDIPPGMQELFVESLMHRKVDMLFQADAAVILPGGIGTLDELWEMAAAQDLRFYEAPEEREQPIVILNTNGFYDATIAQIERGIEDGFIKPGREKLFHFANSPVEAIKVLDRYSAMGRAPVKDLQEKSTGNKAGVVSVRPPQP